MGSTPNSEDIARLLEQAETVYALKKEEEEKELRRKFPLEARIREKLVGQRSAIKTVAAAIRRKENGWQDEEVWAGCAGQVPHHVGVCVLVGWPRADTEV